MHPTRRCDRDPGLPASLSVTLLALAVSILGPIFRPAVAGEPERGAPSDPAGPAISTKTLESLIATLEDEDRRARLVEDLRALVAATRETEPDGADETRGLFGGLLGFFETLSTEVRRTARALAEEAGRVPGQVRVLVARLREPAELRAFVSQAAILGGSLLASTLAGLLAWMLLSRRRAALARVEARPTTSRRLLAAASTLLLDLVPPAVLILVATSCIAISPAAQTTRLLVLAVVWALALQRALSAVIRLVLAPDSPALRLAPLADEHAKELSGSAGAMASLGVYGYFTLQALSAAGVDAALVRPLRSVYGLALLVSGVIVVLKERAKARVGLAGLASRLSKDSPRWGAVRSFLLSVLGLWWLVAIVYMVGLYLAWASAVEGGFAFLVRASIVTALSVAGATIVLSVGRRGLHRLWRLAEPMSARYPEIAVRLPGYRRGLTATFDAVSIAVAAGFALQAWGVSVVSAMETPAVQTIVSSLLGILLIVLLAAALIDVATVFSQRYLESRERAGTTSAKIRTLVPLARTAIRTVIVVISGVMILDQAGIQIAPILAGVGILGLAVGFGAQTLVKDVITGFFILLEDTINVGDVVTLNGTGGLVEAIGIRSVRLRDLSGNVHTIPFGSVGAVTNMTKDFSMYLIEAGVAYREDVDHVISVLQEIDAGLRQDPEYGRDILAPIEILGLDRFEDSAVVVRARLKTKPIQQWRIGREFNRRMKRAFDERGIEIPFPHRTVYFGERKDGTAPPLRVRSGSETPPGDPDRGGAGDEPAPGDRRE